MGGFDFLKNLNAVLYELCRAAELYLQEDMGVAMFKIRQALELIVGKLGAERKNLFDNINFLSDCGKLPENITELFHSVRIYANHCIHYQGGEYHEKPERIMEKFTYIVIWFLAVHEKHEFSCEDFASDYEREIYCNLTGAELIAADTSNLPGQDMKKFEKNPLAVKHFLPEDLFDGQYAGECNDDGNVLDKDIFESEEEYRERIRAMKPRHIGYGILERKSADKYTGMAFVRCHFDAREDVVAIDDNVTFCVSINMLYDDVIDGELAASLDVYEGKPCLDYSRIFIFDYMGNSIPLQVISWHKLLYESDDSYFNRLNTMPVLPLAVCKPYKDSYSVRTGTISFYLSWYDYLKDIIPLKELALPITREQARGFCALGRECIMYGSPKFSRRDNKFYLKALHLQSDNDKLSYDCSFEPFDIQSLFGCETDGLIKYIEEKERLGEQEKWQVICNSKPGDIVEFGRYKSGHRGFSPIEWVVLAVEAKKMLLLSRAAIICQPFYDKDREVTWENSSIRHYLNGSFYSEAFAEQEKKQIKETIVSADKNLRYNVDSGEITCDRIFLLSASEVEKYLPVEIHRLKKATSYAEKNGVYVNADGICRWWLRTSGHSQTTIAEVDYMGKIHYYGMNSGYSKCGVCPAMWINSSLS